jgi:hypothetical protein
LRLKKASSKQTQNDHERIVHDNFVFVKNWLIFHSTDYISITFTTEWCLLHTKNIPNGVCSIEGVSSAPKELISNATACTLMNSYLHCTRVLHWLLLRSKIIATTVIWEILV